MKALLKTLSWDLLIQTRYQILTVSVLVTALYIGMLYAVPMENKDPLLVFLIYSDPALLGFFFIGALVLFERNEGSLHAWVVTPASKNLYLLSKSLSLSLIATLCSFAMAIAGHGWEINYFLLFSGVMLTSVMFTLIGFIAVSQSSNFSSFMVMSAFFLTPLNIPLLQYFGLSEAWFYHLFPSQPVITLLAGAFEPISVGETAIAFGSFAAWIGLFGLIANRLFSSHIIERS